MRPSLQLAAIFALIWTPNLLVSSASRGRQNFFDPIYANDDIDAHTISVAGQQQQQQRQSQQEEMTRKQRANSYQRSFIDGESVSPTFSNLPSSSSSFSPPPSTTQKTTSKAATTSIQVSVGPELSQIEQPIKKSGKNKGEDRHWSALENYYRKLRQPAVSSGQQQQQQQTIQQLPFYQVPQEFEDSLIGAYKPVQSYPPYARNSAGLVVLRDIQNSANSQPFLLPIIEQTNGRNQNSLNEYQSQGSVLSVYKDVAPGISRKSGIGAGSILLAEGPTKMDFNQFQEQLLLGQQNRPILPSSTSPLASYEDGKVKYLEWKKLPELLFIQQQQQRAKHQQETFGSWYDHQRSSELLREEAFCGPRNYVNFHLVPMSPHLPGSSLIGAQPQLTSALLSRLQHTIDPNGRRDVAVALSAGEYPSHMGVYNDTKLGDDNFVCAATWIHERFALTLASCVKSYDPRRLIVRAGEWNLNRNQTTSQQQASNATEMVTREIERIHLFPKYRNDSIEHNLALIEFKRPLEFLDAPYICPACQMQSRSMLKTSSCWTPVRNVTFSEYFDAEGEGETKEKRNVNMIELPVRLIANDENECYRQTKFEYFNFQSPNYICSADFRSANWRARLNQTDYFGSGIYCNEGGNLSLVSILHPIRANSSSAFGYMDLSYYRPWMRNVISGRTF